MSRFGEKTTVLLCTEPRTKKFFVSAASYAFDNPTVLCISEYKKQADIWTGTFLYGKAYGKPNPEFEQEWPDIYPRSLVLRVNDEKLSHEWALRVWNGIEELFRENPIDYVIMPQIDRYLYDIIDRIARKHQTTVIGAESSIFSGYCRMSVRGEYKEVRGEVPEEEVEERVQQLTRDDFLPDSETENIKREHFDIVWRFYRRKLTEDIYYPIMKVLSHDPWGHQFNRVIRKGKHLSDYYCENLDDYFFRIKDIDVNPKKTVYMPLHMTPEATMTYHCSNTKFCNYESCILSLIERADPSITFIVKEHPAMYGLRELSFYRQLKSYPNVILVHPKENSNLLLSKIDTVLTENGTVGVEALVRGKRVLVLDRNCYYLFHPNVFLVDDVTLESLSFELTDYSNTEFVRRLSLCVFKSDFVCDTRKMPACSPEQFGKGIREYINWRSTTLNDETNAKCCLRGKGIC